MTIGLKKIENRVASKYKSAIVFVWMFILVYLILSETRQFEYLANYNGIVTFITILICTILELNCRYKYSIEETVFVWIVIVLFLQSILLSHISIPAEISFYLFVLRKIEKKKFVRITLFTIIFTVGMIIVLYNFHIIPDALVRINGRKLRHSLGFLYPSKAQTYLMITVFLWINAEFKWSTHIIGLAFVNAFSVYCFIVTDTRYPFYISVMASILSVVCMLNQYRFKNKGIIVHAFSLFAPMVPFWLSLFYNSRVKWLAKINNALTGRLSYSLIAIKNRTLHIVNYLPNKEQSSLTSSIYGYLDSGYLNILYNFGIYLYILVVLLLLLATHNSLKEGNHQMVITLMFTILYSLWYGQVLLLLQYSIPLILCTYLIPWNRRDRYIVTYVVDEIQTKKNKKEKLYGENNSVLSSTVSPN